MAFVWLQKRRGSGYWISTTTNNFHWWAAKLQSGCPTWHNAQWGIKKYPNPLKFDSFRNFEPFFMVIWTTSMIFFCFILENIHQVELNWSWFRGILDHFTAIFKRKFVVVFEIKHLYLSHLLGCIILVHFESMLSICLPFRLWIQISVLTVTKLIQGN